MCLTQERNLHGTSTWLLLYTPDLPPAVFQESLAVVEEMYPCEVHQCKDNHVQGHVQLQWERLTQKTYPQQTIFWDNWLLLHTFG